MILRSHAPRRRSGATTVEVALVMSLFLLFLFGIFEYCRYLMMIEVTTNAARDGARYAVVNIGKGSTFSTASYNDGVTTYPSIVSYTTSRMAGVNSMVDGCTVTVFACDSDKLALTPPQAVAKVGSTWNEAQFGERIGVRIAGTYRTILPTFLYMDPSFPVNVVVTMGSEGYVSFSRPARGGAEARTARAPPETREHDLTHRPPPRTPVDEGFILGCDLTIHIPPPASPGGYPRRSTDDSFIRAPPRPGRPPP